MPFDFPAQPETIALPKSLENLSFILRNRQLWPEGFEWDYTHCKSCALGMSVQLWGNNSVYGWKDNHLTEWLPKGSIHSVAGRRIFTELRGHIGRVTMHDVTPEDVADAIDSYLKTAPNRPHRGMTRRNA